MKQLPLLGTYAPSLLPTGRYRSNMTMKFDKGINNTPELIAKVIIAIDVTNDKRLIEW